MTRPPEIILHPARQVICNKAPQKRAPPPDNNRWWCSLSDLQKVGSRVCRFQALPQTAPELLIIRDCVIIAASPVYAAAIRKACAISLDSQASFALKVFKRYSPNSIFASDHISTGNMVTVADIFKCYIVSLAFWSCMGAASSKSAARFRIYWACNFTFDNILHPVFFF